MKRVGKDGKLIDLSPIEIRVGGALRGTGIDEVLGLDGRDQIRYESNAREYLEGDCGPSRPTFLHDLWVLGLESFFGALEMLFFFWKPPLWWRRLMHRLKVDTVWSDDQDE